METRIKFIKTGYESLKLEKTSKVMNSDIDGPMNCDNRLCNPKLRYLPIIIRRRKNEMIELMTTANIIAGIDSISCIVTIRIPIKANEVIKSK